MPLRCSAPKNGFVSLVKRRTPTLPPGLFLSLPRKKAVARTAKSREETPKEGKRGYR